MYYILSNEIFKSAVSGNMAVEKKWAFLIK